MIKKVFLLVIVFSVFAFSAKAESTISVLYFDNLTSGDNYNHLRKALTEMLISDLNELRGITIIEREKIENVMQEIALGQSGLMDKTLAPKVGELVGAQYFIAGSYLTEKKKILITYKLVEVSSAIVIASGNINGKTKDILAAKDALAAHVAQNLLQIFDGITLPEMSGEDEIVSIDHLAEFGRALDYKDQKDFKNAETILKNIASENPDYKLFKDELLAIEQRLKDYDKERNRLLAEKRKEPVTYQSFIQMSSAYVSSMNYSMLLEYCRQLRNSPPKSPRGSLLETGEMIDYYIVLSLQSLKQLEGTIQEGEYFIKNYPASMYYNSVKNYISNAINELKQQEERIKKAESQSKPFINKLASASVSQKQMLYFQIATVYYTEKLFQKAVQYYKMINLQEIQKQGIEGDLILFNIFMCYYSSLQKTEAKETIEDCSQQYPSSDYLTGMRQMFNIMAE